MSIIKPSSTKYLLLSFLIGFASLLYQTYCVHVLFMFFPRSSSIVSLVVSAYLLGLAVSSWLFGKYTHHNTSQHHYLISSSQSLMILIAIFIYANISFIPYSIDKITYLSGYDGLVYSIASHSFIFLYSFLPALCLGGCFPILNGLYIKSKQTATKDVSSMYAWDLLGSVIGCLITGYLLIPYLGISDTIILASISNLFIVFCILLTIKDYFHYTIFIASLSLIIGFIFFDSNEKIITQRDFNNHGYGISKKEFQSFFENPIYQNNSKFGLITVDQKKIGGSASSYALELLINLRGMCLLVPNRDVETSGETLARLAADLVKPGSKALNIGLGCGLTTDTAINHPNIVHVDTLEINPVVIDAYKEVFEDHLNLSKWGDKVEIRQGDGAQFLANGRQLNRYDTIMIDIEEPDIVYSSPIFTRDYMEMAKTKLKEDGIYALWSFYVNKDFSKVLYNTVAAAFPYTKIYSPKDAGVTLMYGSRYPLEMQNVDERKILDVPNMQINTLNNPVLQNYYDPTAIFGTPFNYTEPFTKK